MALVLLGIFIVHISVAGWSAESSTPSSCSDSEVTITYGSDGDSEVTTNGDSKVTTDRDSKLTTGGDSKLTTSDGDSKVTTTDGDSKVTTNGDSKSLANDNRKKLPCRINQSMLLVELSLMKMMN